MIRAIRRYELPTVAIVTIPRLLASIQCSRVGVALRLQVIYRIDCRGRITITYADHNRILV